MAIEIECADCGKSRVARLKNTKYCRLCRLFRDLTFMASGYNAKAECLVCDVTFLRVKRNDVLCGTCDIAAEAAPTGECSFCGETRKLYDEDVTVCRPCIKSPKQRELLLKSVGQKRASRMA
jgi:hypothetical protein